MSPKLWEHGSLIRQARKARGLTQAQLAELVGASEVSVSNWERGTTAPDIPNRMQLARVLDLPLTRLIEATDKPGYSSGDVEGADTADAGMSPEGAELEERVKHLHEFVRMLSGFPGTPLRPEAKIEFLNLYEQAAKEAGQSLPAEYWDIRRRVYEGEL